MGAEPEDGDAGIIEDAPTQDPVEAPVITEHSWRDSLVNTEVGDSKAQIAFKVLFPVGIWLFSFFLVYLIWPAAKAGRWVELSILYLIPPLGKESIIPMGIADGFHPMTMALTVAFVDVVMAMILSWNYWMLKKVPGLGKVLTWVEGKGEASMEKNPGLRSGAWLALLAFLSIPGVGAGGITGSIIGRMVGMRPGAVISAVLVGAILNGLMYAYLADVIIQLFIFDTVIGIVALIIIIQIALFMFMAVRYRNMRKWGLELEESEA